MAQSLPHTTQLFRTSLRDWQASYKAQQAETATPAATTAPTRVKRLAARKKKMRNAALESGSRK